MYYLEKHDNLFWHDFVQKSGGKMEDVLHLPFLCIFGRSDGTLSFDGANVFPNQIERAILRDDELEKKTNRFKIEKKYDKTHNVQFHVHIELKLKNGRNSTLLRQYGKVILDGLMDLNPDFKESYTKNTKLKPMVHLYPSGHPFFKVDDVKAKNMYIVKNANGVK
jgi:phenylacetate-CoA ligase